MGLWLAGKDHSPAPSTKVTTNLKIHVFYMHLLPLGDLCTSLQTHSIVFHLRHHVLPDVPTVVPTLAHSSSMWHRLLVCEEDHVLAEGHQLL